MAPTHSRCCFSLSAAPTSENPSYLRHKLERKADGTPACWLTNQREGEGDMRFQPASECHPGDWGKETRVGDAQ